MKLTLEKPVYGGDCLGRATASEDKPGEGKSGKTEPGKAIFADADDGQPRTG